MTGIERLRELADKYAELGKDHTTIDVVPSGMAMLFSSIADQIDREQACDGDTAENIRLIVGGVVDEMERHCLGVEGMDDSPVARWARELREALDAGRDPADERDAIAWVREHGGIAYVKDAWNVRRNLDRQLEKAQAKVERQQRHIESIQSKLSERREHIENIANDVRNQCLAFGVDVSECDDEFDMLHDLNEALSKRLMPVGMEWPRFQDGEPVPLICRSTCQEARPSRPAEVRVGTVSLCSDPGRRRGGEPEGFSDLQSDIRASWRIPICPARGTRFLGSRVARGCA